MPTFRIINTLRSCGTSSASSPRAPSAATYSAPTVGSASRIQLHYTTALLGKPTSGSSTCTSPNVSSGLCPGSWDTGWKCFLCKFSYLSHSLILSIHTLLMTTSMLMVIHRMAHYIIHSDKDHSSERRARGVMRLLFGVILFAVLLDCVGVVANIAVSAYNVQVARAFTRAADTLDTLGNSTAQSGRAPGCPVIRLEPLLLFNRPDADVVSQTCTRQRPSRYLELPALPSNFKTGPSFSPC